MTINHIDVRIDPLVCALLKLLRYVVARRILAATAPRPLELVLVQDETLSSCTRRIWPPRVVLEVASEDTPSRNGFPHR